MPASSKDGAEAEFEGGGGAPEVVSILQNPELPTGCEVTAATMLLNAYGYDVEKTELADALEKDSIETVDDKDYAVHPEVAFIGNPIYSSSFGVFPHPVAKAMQKFIDEQGGEHVATPLYGLTEEEILAYCDAGIPLCIWSSMNNTEIKYIGGWHIIADGEYTEEYFYWPANEHCLVLTDYDSENVYVCDPLKGECSYPRESFFRHYEQVGCYALVMGPVEILYEEASADDAEDKAEKGVSADDSAE